MLNAHTITESSATFVRPRIKSFSALLDFARELRPKRVGVMYPTSEETFEAILRSRREGFAQFVLVGEEDLIRHHLGDTRLDGIDIVSERSVATSLRRVIEMSREGEIDIIMKGGIDTSTMMKEILKEESGIRTHRLMSDIFLMETPTSAGSRLMMITDGGMTLAPDLKHKVELIRNAVSVAHALGNPLPKVAVLSATEFVLQNLPSTIDAAALSKMNERGQITGCLVDGPLALDNAVSPEAAEEKGLRSPVAGYADILVAANIESANSLAKSTTYFAGLRLAHVIVGGNVPVLIPSRADSCDAKVLSVALGVIMRHSEESAGSTKF